jgi:hypothetical protein
MLGLALACVAIGVAPVLAVAPALRVGAAIGGVGGGEAAAEAVGPALATISIVALGLLVLTGAGWWLRGLVLRGRPLARAETWGSGYARPDARMQYTAASFAAPLITAYGAVAGVQVERGPGRLGTHPREVMLEHVALPVWARVRALAIRLRPIQHGRLWAYVLYLLGTLLVLLLYLVIRVAEGGP